MAVYDGSVLDCWVVNCPVRAVGNPTIKHTAIEDLSALQRLPPASSIWPLRPLSASRCSLLEDKAENIGCLVGLVEGRAVCGGG